MYVQKYLNLLYARKITEAEAVRKLTIPNRLIKFVWLDGSKNDGKKFKSLKQEQIWISHVSKLNDPYEFKGLIIDEEKFKNAGYSQEHINLYKTIFEMEDIGVTCLSGNDIDYLPMWAYYTNNYRGFCIEYEVLNKEIIHEVCYESKRIAVASLLTQYVASAEEAMKTGKMRSDEADRIGKVLLYNLYIKAKAWEHEKEFRIPYPVNDKIGKNVNIRDTGLKTNRIIAGINCIPEDIQRLNDISNQIGCGNVYRSKLSDTKYALEVDNSDYVYRQKRKYFMCCRKHR